MLQRGRPRGRRRRRRCRSRPRRRRPRRSTSRRRRRAAARGGRWSWLGVYEETRTSSSRPWRVKAGCSRPLESDSAPTIAEVPSMTLDVHTLDQVLLVGAAVLLLSILAVRLSVGFGLPTLLLY